MVSEILNKERILEQARAFIDEGKFDKAIREYEKIILADPGDLRVKLRIAELYTRRKQITEAIRIYREVAGEYATEGFYLKAVTVQKNILRLNPSLVETNEQLAMLYEKMGLMADAIRQYDILASALDMKGMADKVIEVREKILKLNPEDPAARIRLAELYQREGKMEDALDQYEAYTKTLEASGADKARLADVYEKILTHRHGRPEILAKLIALHEKSGDYKRMLKWMEAEKDIVERDPELLRRMARIYASQNQNETARSKYMILADLLKERKDIDGALDAYCEVLVLTPDEEDRLERRVEELKPGALATIVARAQKKRAELEREELLRQQAEEAARQATNHQGASEAKKAAPVKAPEKKTEAAPIQKAAGPPPAPEAKTSRKEADSAFDLGMAYSKMGLAEESAAEFGKAKEIYGKYQEEGAKDADIPERLMRIEKILGGSSRHEMIEKKANDKKKKVSFV